MKYVNICEKYSEDLTYTVALVVMTWPERVPGSS